MLRLLMVEIAMSINLPLPTITPLKINPHPPFGCIIVEAGGLGAGSYISIPRSCQLVAEFFYSGFGIR